jgi:enoyl-CoA hydratase
VRFRYELPPEIQVEIDGSIRIVRLNRPDDLNATNHVLHKAIADTFLQLHSDPDARAVVVTGNGRAFCAGGDLEYLDQVAKDPVLRRETIEDGRRIVRGMVACRHPIVAAVNGPAVGLGCSVVALSDVVYIAESAHLADPHLLIGLVAADGAAVTWPLLISLQLAKEYALTGDRIPSRRAAEIGLANHVVSDDAVLSEALACAKRIADLPRQATEDTKRLLNIPLERAVSAALDFAFAAEDRSFASPEVRANVDQFLERRRRA